jgi:GxxExxY protein
MEKNMEERQHSEVTDAIICCFYNVYNGLGYGFLEKVYENSLAIELKGQGLIAVKQQPIATIYKGQIVGEYFCDLLVENKVIVEIKASINLAPEHESQLLNYLKATDVEVGLLLNFGPKPEVRRKAFNNSRKPNLTQSLTKLHSLT